MSIKTTIKTIAFILMVQFISGNLMASITNPKTDITISKTDRKTRPGDGDDQHDARTKNGESLKGYFYRLYGDNDIFARSIEFEGPFKRPRLHGFLQNCQDQNGTIRELYTVVKKEETIEARGSLDKKLTGILIHHITLQTRVVCLFEHKKTTQAWAAVYLDSDINSDDGIDVYVDYDYCDTKDKMYLEVGKYSIHYDQNPECHADLSGIPDS